MTVGSRFLRSLVSALAAAIGMILVLTMLPRPARAGPGTLCVAPGGAGCDGLTCGGTCFPTVQEAVDAAATDDEIYCPLLGE